MNDKVPPPQINRMRIQELCFSLSLACQKELTPYGVFLTACVIPTWPAHLDFLKAPLRSSALLSRNWEEDCSRKGEQTSVEANDSESKLWQTFKYRPEWSICSVMFNLSSKSYLLFFSLFKKKVFSAFT